MLVSSTLGNTETKDKRLGLLIKKKKPVEPPLIYYQIKKYNPKIEILYCAWIVCRVKIVMNQKMITKNIVV